MNRSIQSGIIVASLFFGCAAQAEEVSTVKFSSECPSAGAAQALPALLLSVVLGPLIQAGISGLGSALTNAGAPKDVHRIAYGSDSFYAIDVNEGGSEAKIAKKCILYAFGPRSGPKLPPLSSMESTSASQKFLKEVGFDVAPAVYVEAEFQLSPDLTAFRFVPRFAWVGAPIGSIGAASKKRDIAITYSLLVPGPSDDAAALAARTILIKDAQSRSTLDAKHLQSLQSSWMPLPPLPESISTRIQEAITRRADLKRLKAEKVDLSQNTLKPDEKKRLLEIDKQIPVLEAAATDDATYLTAVGPVNLRVDLHETRDGNAVLTKIGGFLSSKAGELATPIANQIDPSKRGEARAAKLEDAITADAKETTVRVAAINEVSAWQEVEADVKSTSAQRRIARLKAETACRELTLRKFAEEACLLLAP